MTSRPSFLPHEAPLLAALGKDAAQTLVSLAEGRHARAGQILQTAGQPGTHLFLMQRGSTRYYSMTERGDEIVLRILAAGEAFGLVSLLARPMPYMASVDAMSDCDMLVWESRRIHSFMQRYPQIRENALQITLGYLKEYVERHARLISGTAKGRLSVTLLDLARRIGIIRPHGIEIDVTNEVLGHLSDISRFTTSRLLRAWERKGVTIKTRGKLIIHSPEGLTGV